MGEDDPKFLPPVRRLELPQEVAGQQTAQRPMVIAHLKISQMLHKGESEVQHESGIWTSYSMLNLALTVLDLSQFYVMTNPPRTLLLTLKMAKSDTKFNIFLLFPRLS